MRWHRHLVARHWAYPHHPSIDEVLTPKSWPRCCVWPEGTPAGDTCGSEANAPSSAWSFRPPRSAPFCAATTSAPHHAAAGPTWTEFLGAHAPGMVAGDLFTVDTIGLPPRSVLFFIELERRRVWLAGVTAHPTGDWFTQTARNLSATLADDHNHSKFLIGDRDTKFAASYDQVFAAPHASSEPRSKRLGPTLTPGDGLVASEPNAWTGC